ncbi:MAG: hypothetical protein J5936_06060, partial [Acholeplasmatales bacterium]|nr:hypothetical protein [Acholeplasmatales bacterium]
MIIPRRYIYQTYALLYNDWEYYVNRDTEKLELRFNYVRHIFDNTPNIKMVASNLNMMVALKDDGTIISDPYSLKLVPDMNDAIFVSTGGSVNNGDIGGDNGIILIITKDHKLYGYGNDNIANINFRRLGIDNTATPVEIVLPDNEVPFMCATNDRESVIVTMNGNAYYTGLSKTLPPVSTFTKLPITNVAYAAAANSVSFDNNNIKTRGIAFLKYDGTLWSFNANAEIVKVMDNIISITGGNGHIGAVDIDGHGYIIRAEDIVSIPMNNLKYVYQANETSPIITCIDNNNTFYGVSASTNPMTIRNMTIVDSIIRTAMYVKNIEVVQVSKDAINNSFVSTSQSNSRTFYVKTTFEDVLESDYSRNVVNYVCSYIIIIQFTTYILSSILSYYIVHTLNIVLKYNEH